MIVDDVKITVAAGKGGDGLAAFSRVKFAKGPTGGNGGEGGNIYLEGVADLGSLRQFRFKKDFYADNGKGGKSSLNDGHDADDLTLYVPTGTVCHNITKPERSIEITKIGQRELIAKGGRGGKGNWHFRSATNTSPRQSEPGRPGEAFELRLELKMIADVGLIGLPNVGKSSLLNELTNAKSKVANYPFTTLEPHLGAYYDIILADIPGLIEGASTGKGLGTKFLRHVERTRVIFHLIAAESADPLIDYKTVRGELESYGTELINKPEYIFISKSDSVNGETLLKIKDTFNSIGKEIMPFSIIDGSINEVKKILNNLIEDKKNLSPVA